MIYETWMEILPKFLTPTHVQLLFWLPEVLC